MDAVVAECVDMLLNGAPGAQAIAKELLRTVDGLPLEEQRRYTAGMFAYRRTAMEGREGMGAFLEKRNPDWQT